MRKKQKGRWKHESITSGTHESHGGVQAGRSSGAGVGGAVLTARVDGDDDVDDDDDEEDDDDPANAIRSGDRQQQQPTHLIHQVIG